MKRRLFIVVAGILLAACSQEEDWYDEASRAQARKEERIEELRRAGMSDVDAARRQALEHAIMKTRTGGMDYPGMRVSGDELQEALRPHPSEGN